MGEKEWAEEIGRVDDGKAIGGIFLIPLLMPYARVVEEEVDLEVERLPSTGKTTDRVERRRVKDRGMNASL